MKIAVVSPHFDDAVLSCWSVVAGEDEVAVVTTYTAAPKPGLVTDWDADTGVDSATRMRQRAAENRAALALAHCRPIDLGCLEMQYGGGEIDVDSLAHELGDADVVYAPAGTGVDNLSFEHIIVRDACRALRPDCRLYADQPYCLFRPDVELLPVPPGPELRRRVVCLTREQRRRKTDAIAKYTGEVPKLERLYGPMTDPERLCYEVFWLPPA